MSFISDDDKSQFQNAYKEFFDGFKEDIIIHRRAKVVVVDVNLTQLFGYEEPSNTSNHTYETENSTFKGLVIHPSSQAHRNISALTYIDEIGMRNSNKSRRRLQRLLNRCKHRENRCRK